jgi:hypothetical protein
MNAQAYAAPTLLPAARRANGGRCKDHEARNIEGADYAVRPFDVLRSLIKLYHSSVRYHSLSG